MGALEYQNEVADDGPAGYWRFEEASGSTTFAASLGSGTWTKQLVVSAGVAGFASGSSALDLTNGTINCTGYLTSPVMLSGSGWSVDLWFFMKQANCMLMQCGSGTVGNGKTRFSLSITSGQLLTIYIETSAAGATTTVTQSTGFVPLNQWTHLAATYGGGRLKLYMNGQLVAQNLSAGTPVAPNLGSWFGAWAGDNNGVVQNYTGRGVVDELATYDFELSAARVLAHYQAATASLTNPSGVCIYGSEPKTGAPAWFMYEQLDLPSLIGWIANWVTNVILGLPTYPQDTAVFCATDPPTDLPTAGDYAVIWNPPLALATGAYGRIANLARARKWAELCQCKVPGTTYVEPDVEDPPTGSPSAPTAPVCTDIDDLCGVVFTLDQRVNELATMVQVFQGYEHPYSYRRGTVHAGLTGHAEFAVEPIVGLLVDITARPVELGSAVGTPPAIFGMGVVSVGRSDGWLRATQLINDPQLVLNLPGLVSRVGYSLAPGVTATITELLPA